MPMILEFGLEDFFFFIFPCNGIRGVNHDFLSFLGDMCFLIRIYTAVIESLFQAYLLYGIVRKKNKFSEVYVKMLYFFYIV